MTRWLVLAPLLWPHVAAADPVTIGAVVSWWASYGWVVQVVLAAAAVYGSVEARRRAKAARAQQRAKYNDSLENRSVTILGAAPYWRIVYGRPGPVGGAIVAIFTTDKSGIDSSGNAYTKPDGLKHMVVEIAHHECEAIHEVYLDGVPVGPLDGSGNATSGSEFYVSSTYVYRVEVGAGGFVDLPGVATQILTQQVRYGSGDSESIVDLASCTLSNGNTRVNYPGSDGTAIVALEISRSYATVRVQKHLGAAAQTVDTYLNGLLPTEWDSNHRLRGATYAVITLDLEEPRFQGGPPNFTFDVSGKKVYDPRTTLTTYSENNALCIRDYLLAEYGWGVDAADINAAALSAAADACDELISLTIGATTTTNQKRYTLNGTFTTDAGKEQILDEMADSMGGVVTNAGEWFVRAGVWTAPVMDLTEADLSGLIEVQRTATDYEELFNGMRGMYVPRSQATPVEFDQYQNAAFVTADGEELWEDRDLPWTDNKARARNLSRIFVETQRLGLTITFPAKLKAIRLQPGDRVRVSSIEHGWALKHFRVVDWQMSLQSAVMLVLREDEEASYDEADAATANPSPNAGLPNPWVVSAPTGVAVSSALRPHRDGSVQTSVTVAWDAVTGAYVTQGGWVRVRWSRAIDADKWISADVPGDARSSTFVGPAPGTKIIVRIGLENSNRAAGAEVFAVHTLPASAIGDLELVAHGAANAMTVNGASATKVSGGSAWNAGVYSQVAIAGACEVSARIPALGQYVMLGLNVDPVTDASYTSIDHALYQDGTTTWKAYESGVTAASGAVPALGDVIRVRYTGPAIEYWVNSTKLRSILVGFGKTFYLDGSFYAPGNRLEALSFGAITAKSAEYRLSAYGYLATPPAAVDGKLVGLDDGVTVVAPSRSYLVAAFSPATGLVTYAASFDVHLSPTNAAAMAAALNALADGTIVAVWTHDEPRANRLTNGLDTAMYRCGASRNVYGAPGFKARSAYALIGIAGCGHGNGFEAYRGDVDDAADAYVRASFQITPTGQLIVDGRTFTGLLPGVVGTMVRSTGAGGNLLSVAAGTTQTATISSAAWTNDLNRTVRVQVTVPVTFPRLTFPHNLSTGKFYAEQTGAVGGSSSADLVRLNVGSGAENLLPGATWDEYFEVAAGATLNVALKATGTAVASFDVEDTPRISSETSRVILHVQNS